MKLLNAVFIALALFGCAGGPTSNRAIAPAPLAEIPSVLRIPDGVSISTQEIQSAPATGALKLFVGPGNEFSDEIALGPDLYAGTAAFVDALLAPLHAIEIPVGLEDRFKGDFSLALPVEAGGDGSERIFHVKMLFTPYDADADGADDGCSGNTQDLPICFRLWLDDTRFMAGRFDQYPTDTNRGAGLFKIATFFESGMESESPPIGVVYNQADLLNQSVDLNFFTVFLGGDGLAFSFIHSAITSQGPEATAERNVKVSGLVDDSDAEEFTPNASSQYIGEYRVDQPLWRGELHLDNIEDPDLSEFDDVCAEFESGSQVGLSLCELIGLDDPAERFASFPKIEDILFPPAFSPDPGF